MNKDVLADIGKRIKDRREAMNLSQEELRKKVGYSNRSMIARIERGDINLTSSKIGMIAKALDTTPAYIMGWDNEDDDNTLAARLLYRYRALDELDQELARRILKCDENFNKI